MRLAGAALRGWFFAVASVSLVADGIDACTCGTTIT
jgi:hypothetical protein